MTKTPTYSWVVLTFTVVTQALGAGAVIFGFPIYVVEVKNTLDVSLSELMLAIVFMQFALGIFATPCGYLLERISIRWLLVLGSAFMSTGLVLTSAITQSWQLIALYATVLPIGLLLTGGLISQLLIVQWFDVRRGFALGISATGTALGGVIFPLVVAAFISNFGWRESLQLSAIIVGPLIAVPGIIILRRNPGKSLEAEVDSASETKAESTHNKYWSTTEILSSTAFWLPVVSLMTFLAVYDGVKFNLGDIMALRGYDTHQAALLITIVSASMVIGKLAIGYLADITAHHKIIWMCSGLFALSLYLLQSDVGGLGSIQVAAALVGFAGGATLPMRAIMLAEHFGQQSLSRVLGISFTFVMFGGFGAYLAAWLRDTLGDYDQVYALLAVLLIVPVVAMMVLRRQRVAVSAKVAA